MSELSPGDFKILVADDEPDVLDLMAKGIEKEGYQVVKAADGQEAWAKATSELPDIVILDLTMPKMHGFEVLKKLREEFPVDKWQPVIIVSALGELENMQKGFDLAADHYLVKPCSIDEILKAIKLMANLIPQRKSQSEIDSDETKVE